MGILNTIFGGVASIKDLVLGLAGKLPPEQEAKLKEVVLNNQEKFAELDQQIQMRTMDLEQQLNQMASENIRAESTSMDWFVRRSRPAVIWMGNVILGWNYIVLEAVKTIAKIYDNKLELPTFMPPEWFWYVWGGLVAGYIFSRTGDKFFGGKGGAVKLGPINLESKGD